MARVGTGSRREVARLHADHGIDENGAGIGIVRVRLRVDSVEVTHRCPIQITNRQDSPAACTMRLHELECLIELV